VSQTYRIREKRSKEENESVGKENGKMTKSEKLRKI
jgi:hypothetical protein